MLQAKDRTVWDLLGQSRASLQDFMRPWELGLAVQPTQVEGLLSLVQPLDQISALQESISLYKAADPRFGNDPKCTVSSCRSVYFSPSSRRVPHEKPGRR